MLTGRLTIRVVFHECLEDLYMARDLLPCAGHTFVRKLTRGKTSFISEPYVFLDKLVPAVRFAPV